MRKISQFYRPPFPTVAIFSNVDANNFLKVGDIWFCDAARHNNDDKIKIHNALVWVLQDLSKSPRTTSKDLHGTSNLTVLEEC